MPDTDLDEHPPWFELDPDGPHIASGGLGLDDYSYVWFCAKDGHTWPCPTEQARRG